MLVDFHAHLDFDAYGQDRDAVIARAKTTGVQHVVLIGQFKDGMAAAREALLLARTDPAYFSATAGIHPHEAAKATERDFAELRELCSEPDIVAVGECGLD